ncbi:putative MFS family arabinose efflux permease [Streptomyces sp. 1114.5]|uniref:MFS transporter n=1 Tax=Streptomyces sp. 1114.5 TaxID=1938830 RepID=UPI000EAE6985|nr:MFS transporter [Streptomyces sp. 1114.5]RKT11450.1 putative MFS family arabinose efflux permease [Streptomyces sp. 1114.5]
MSAHPTPEQQESAQQAPTHQVPARPHPRRWWALCALLTAEAMNLLDATIVQVAAPRMRADLGGPAAAVPWLTTAYTLPFAVLLLTGGRLGDRAGRRRVFRVGVVGFLLASLACACAPTLGTLLVFRAVQGAAAAVIVPQTIGLIKAMFRGPETARALGTIGPVMGLAAVSGPVLGGVLTHADLFGSSWRSVFLVNLPLALAVLALAPQLTEDRAPRRPGLDPVGSALAALATGLVVLPLLAAGSTPPGWTAAGAALGAAVAVGFAVHQRRGARRGADTLVEPSLFTTARFPAALTALSLAFAATTGLSLVVVLQLQLGSGADALASGLTLLPMSAGLAVGSVWAGTSLVRRYGARVMPAGIAVMAAGMVAAVAAYRTGERPELLPYALAVVGLGQGLFTPAFFTTALRPLRPQETGSAAGLLNAVQQLGSTLGVAVLGRIYLSAPQAAGAQHACWMALGVLAAVAVAARVMSTTHDVRADARADGCSDAHAGSDPDSHPSDQAPPAARTAESDGVSDRREPTRAR